MRDEGPFRLVVRKTLLTVGFGAVSLGVALKLGDANAVQAVTIAVIIGSAALMVDFLREFEQRLHDLGRDGREAFERSASALDAAAERIRSDVDRRFAQLTTVPEAFGLQPLDRARAADLVQVVQNAYAFEHRSSPLANSFVRAEAQRFSLLLNQLRSGEGTYDGEDRDWLLTLTRSCARTLDATSLTTTDAGGRFKFTGGFWESDLGLHYLERQADAVNRGVSVRRIFILENTELTGHESYRQTCTRQRDLGFDIRYLTPDMISVSLHNKLDDFIVFDNEISYEVVPSLAPGDARPVISKTHLLLTRTLVAERVRQFAKLWDAALPCADNEDETG